jgi:hypothetical protein
MKKFIKICGVAGKNPALGLAADGTLWHSEDKKSWEPLDFNEMYAGYYPSCTFTALEYCTRGFVAAGLDKDMLPLVFQSLSGGVWEMLNLASYSPIALYTRATGKINRILSDETTGQLFLLCANGELVTLPECPKCVQIAKVSDKGITDGWIEDGALILILEDGVQLRKSLFEARQLRISLSYAKERLSLGGYLVDLRIAGHIRPDKFADSIPVSPDQLPDWLSGISKQTFLAFFCEYGVNADAGAQYARVYGFQNAYSVGGVRDFFHVE